VVVRKPGREDKRGVRYPNAGPLPSRAPSWLYSPIMGARWSVLVVDDDELVRSMLASLLDSRGYQSTCVGDVASAARALAAEHFDAVLLDMYLPDGEGMSVLDRTLEIDPAPVVLMMTARAEIRAAVDAIHRGAFDFLEKPLDLEDLATRLDRAQENARLRRKLAAYEANDREAASAVVKSGALQEAFAIAGRVAATPASSALVLGESGVGKEVLAARIHEQSDRRNGPFVRVNLAAIPESMIEAELFGSVRGAFTDSKRDRAGHFASAEGGTILLDEICEFKVELQPKLLRALEERRFFPVGSDRERRMNVRVLAATNRDPQECIAKGTLRADLYYRLATVVLRVPPLRERRDDILPLAEHFCERFRAEFRRPRIALSGAARDALLAYRWPGNVRELKNVIERATMLAASDTIGPDDLGLPLDPEALKAVAAVATGDATRLEDAERIHIVRVLESVGGSRTRAATLLGISRSTLWEKGKRHGLF
jgi:two-component system, NtrC family, response regulator AtoC